MSEWGGLCERLDKKIGDELYLNDCYMHPKDYINNNESKIKPQDYKNKN